MIGKVAWKLTAATATGVTAAVAQRLLRTGWRQLRGHEPPAGPADPETSIGESLAWAGASAAVLALSREAATRSAASGWERAIGAAPPVKRKRTGPKRRS